MYLLNIARDSEANASESLRKIKQVYQDKYVLGIYNVVHINNI